jgi:hypothetical protein
VLEADAQTYARLGIRHLTTFAVWIDADYMKRFGEPGAIQEYGETLRQQPVAPGGAPGALAGRAEVGVCDLLWAGHRDVHRIDFGIGER